MALDPGIDEPVAKQCRPVTPSAAMLCTPDEASVGRALDRQLFAFRPPVDVAVAERSKRSQTKLKRCHLLTEPYPKRGVVRIAQDIYVATPELAFVQAAPGCSLVELAVLGCFLCGRYAFRDDAERSMQSAFPVTSVELLRQFVGRNGHLRGGRAARRALRYAVDGSASPMETELVLLLCLPCMYGGFGLPFPVLNEVLEPSQSERLKMGQNSYACDLLWREARVAVEYDGEEFHTGIARIAHDAGRRNDLSEFGLTVLVVTKRQLYDTEALTRVAKQVAGRLGTSLRIGECAYDWGARHAELRRRLLYRGCDASRPVWM